MDVELLCQDCMNVRQKGALIKTEFVCRACFEYATTEIGDLSGIHGTPEIRIRAEPFDVLLERSPLPREAGQVVDIAPVAVANESVWLLLSGDGLISRYNANTGEFQNLARSSVCLETGREPWCGHNQKQRLHASLNGDFAAIVNDYARYGQIVDMRTGHITLALDGGDYHPETVPFSFAFAQVNGQLIAIHRTAWNRLDISDPSTGRLLTAREPTSYQHGEERPKHYLDYFHGALYISPSNTKIADDGWVWHPVGIPTIWNVEDWLANNVWESEDGGNRQPLCARAYYWGHAFTWLDNRRIAIGGIGDDEKEIVDGVRIFDYSSSYRRPNDVSSSVRELTSFAGPSGSLFSDGQSLFSADEKGLFRWNVIDEVRTGFVAGFNPTHHHRVAEELVQVVDTMLVRWKMPSNGSTESLSQSA